MHNSLRRCGTAQQMASDEVKVRFGSARARCRLVQASASEFGPPRQRGSISVPQALSKLTHFAEGLRRRVCATNEVSVTLVKKANRIVRSSAA